MTTSNEHNNAPSVPQGWKLVPIEPTLAMGKAYLSAARLHAADGKEDKMRFSPGGYAAMLAATPAPAPAQGVGLTDEEIEAIAKKHMSTVGDHWCNEEAIREIHAEDFARAIIAALLAKGRT